MDHWLAITSRAPARRNARCIPIAPSRGHESPTPDWQAESTTHRTPDRSSRETSVAVSNPSSDSRALSRAWFAPASASHTRRPIQGETMGEADGAGDADAATPGGLPAPGLRAALPDPIRPTPPTPRPFATTGAHESPHTTP